MGKGPLRMTVEGFPLATKNKKSDIHPKWTRSTICLPLFGIHKKPHTEESVSYYKNSEKGVITCNTHQQENIETQYMIVYLYSLKIKLVRRKYLLLKNR